MSAIPTSVTQEQFEAYVMPYVSTARRGYVSKIPLYKIFNYVLYRLHTGCQWHQVPIVAGNHNDAYALKPNLQDAFKAMKRLGLSIAGAFFNADSAFDTRDARKVCFNHHVIPNIDENKRNRKTTKLGRKRLFNPPLYK